MTAQERSREIWGPGESFQTGSSQKREDMALYVEWLLTPPEDRQPKTKTAFAESLGVTLQTLRNWAKEPFVQRELADKARAVARIDRLPAVLDTLYATATDGENSRSVAAAKVLMDWMRETSTLREADMDTENMSEQELVAVALELLQRTADKKET